MAVERDNDKLRDTFHNILQGAKKNNAPYPYNSSMPYHNYGKEGNQSEADVTKDYQVQRDLSGGGTAEGSNDQYRLDKGK